MRLFQNHLDLTVQPRAGGILLDIREDIPCRCIKQTTLNNSFEGFFVELNLRSKKWLLGCSYNHHKENIASHLSNTSTALNKLCRDYEYQHFLNIFIEILNKHAPMKIKYLRANQGKFMTKDLLKAIMKRSRLRNKFLRDRTEMSRKEYKKQRNFCVNLLKKAKKDHFANLDVNSVLDNRKFWQNVKPLFSNKVKAKTIIKLIENGETIDNEIKIAKIFNEYFVNTVKI